MAEDALSGFDARDALVGTDGAAALVLGNDGIAVLKRHGAKVAARRLVPSAVAPALARRARRSRAASGCSARCCCYGVLPEDVDRLEAQLTLM